MILRAVFWIGLVALLAPHPAIATASPSAAIAPAAQTAPLTAACDGRCSGSASLLHVFLNTHLRLVAGLADVQSQIEADQHMRAQRAKGI